MKYITQSKHYMKVELIASPWFWAALVFFVSLVGDLIIQYFSEERRLGRETAVIRESVPLESVPAPARRAMTWIINTAVYTNLYNSGNIYVQARYDDQTNAYSGDTSVDLALPLLCIYKSKELINNPIPTFTQSVPTPGGAEKNSWSGGKVFAIPNVVGRSLLSSTDADNKCNEAGKNRYGLSGSRMAEFHDGSAPNAGWGFWAESIDPNLLIPGNRYWVKINDQNANPW